MVYKRESVTAKLCAFVRAWHSNRSREKIYDDYLAYDMMGRDAYEEIYQLIQHGFSDEMPALSVADTEAVIEEYIAPIPLSRIHFSESRLQEFVAEQEEVQYVICGAGSDTFAFRNTNPHLAIYEIDHPDTQRYKLERLKTLEWNIPPQVHFVSVDFETEQMSDKLLAAGFDPHRKTFFSILGVSYYLTLPIFTKTLEQIAAVSARDSVLVFDYPQKSGAFPRRVYRLEQITRSLGEEMQGGFAYDEVSRALFSLGFQIDAHWNPRQVQAHYFDQRQDGLHAFENVSLLSAVYTGGRVYE